MLKLNFELPANLINNKKGTFLFGGRLRSKKKERNNTFFSYEPINATEDLYGDITMLPLADETANDFYPGSKFKAGQFITPAFLGGINFKDAASYEETDEPSEYLAGNYKAKETITAGYISLKQEITSKLSANIGVRIEHTQINYTGNIIEEEETLKGTATLKNNYTDVLPSVNLTYRFNSNLVLKGPGQTLLHVHAIMILYPILTSNLNDQELSARQSSTFSCSFL